MIQPSQKEAFILHHGECSCGAYFGNIRTQQQVHKERQQKQREQMFEVQMPSLFERCCDLLCGDCSQVVVGRICESGLRIAHEHREGVIVDLHFARRGLDLSELVDDKLMDYNSTRW
ncbi:unnamed protein product [Hapterophycus canaliculatus]